MTTAERKVSPLDGFDNQNGVVITEISEETLDNINGVVASAIDTWDISQRVKRLALPSYLYTRIDTQHLKFFGAWRNDALIGVVALEPMVNGRTESRCAMLLHGLYVDPREHGRGIGARLVALAKSISLIGGFSELLVRAERNAVYFFRKQGFRSLQTDDKNRDYPHQLVAELATVRAG
jgi:N-acetylglutamate synthase-like GNAT family acetyltransferase